MPGWTFFFVQDISDTCTKPSTPGAVVGDVGDAARILRTGRILRGDTFPGIGFQLLHAQADALSVGVEADNLNLHRLTDNQGLGRVVDAAPGDVGDMQQTIDTAEINERAVVGDVLHHAIQDHAFLEALDQLAALFRTGFFKHRATRDDDVAAGAVHLQDLERLRRAHQRADVADGADIDLAAGQERDGAAEVDGEAALDPAVDRAIDALLRFERLFKIGPRLFAAGLFTRQDDRTILVFVAFDIKLDHVAGLDVRLGAGRAKFLQGNTALGLQADIDDGEFVGQANNPAGDDGAVKASVCAECFVEKRGEIFALEVVLHGLLRARGGG